MGLSGCYRFIQYLMVLINSVFWLVGFAVVILSIWMLTDPTFYFSMAQEQNHYNIALFIFLSAGVLMLIVAFLGCCGAFKESQCLLISFFGCLLVILVAEIAAGIWAYTNCESLELKIRKSVKTTVQEEYMVIDSRTQTLDVIQQELYCCGADGPSDWSHSKFSEISSKNKPEISLAVTNLALKYSIPKSCCKKDITDEECIRATQISGLGAVISKNIYSQGCTDKFVETVRLNMMIVAVVTLGIIFMEILGIIFSLTLCIAINRSERCK